MTNIATPENVFAAADELNSRGVNPTIESVIEVIGGGSKSTVGPLLSAWRFQAQRDVEPVPKEFEQRAHLLARALWIEAMKQANARVQAARAQFEVQLKARDIAVEQLLAELKQQEVARHDAEAQLARADVDSRRHENAIAALQAQNTLLRDQLAQSSGNSKSLQRSKTTSSTA